MDTHYHVAIGEMGQTAVLSNSNRCPGEAAFSDARDDSHFSSLLD